MTIPASNGLLQVSGLETHFPLGGRWLDTRQWVRAVDGVSLHIEPGEVLGLVGESGSGKTTLGRSILSLARPTAGKVWFDGIDVLNLSDHELRQLRKRMQIIYQDPYKSLSPRMQIGQIIAEPIRLHLDLPESEMTARVSGLLGKVGLKPYFRHRYPHEMSGGQRQRIAIARALAMEPDFIVADEPVSALDVSVQAQILNILIELQRSEGIAMLLISHDLAVVERVADRVAVMYCGKIMETATTATLIDTPLHPYTQALISAVPAGRPAKRKPVLRPATEVALAAKPVRGCPFAPRCPLVRDVCRKQMPALKRASHEHEVACHARAD